MKKILLTLTLLFSLTAAFAQMENPVKWDYSFKKTSDKTVDVYLTATLAPGWHLYAMDAGEGPQSTEIKFLANPLIKADEAVRQEGKMKKEYDENFGSELKYFENKVSFVQKFKMKSKVPTAAKGNITYMVCNDKKCLPPKTVNFDVKIK